MAVHPHVAIVGATGAVGAEFLAVLEQRRFPIASLKLLASARSKGRQLEYQGKPFAVEVLAEDSFAGINLALFTASGSISRQFAPLAVAAGAVVVDNSSAFRMDAGTPLIVPEVNAQQVQAHNGIIANPNCSTIIMNVPVWPLHKANPIKRIVVSTYQSASGAGAQAMAELESQTQDVLAGKPAKPAVLPHQCAFNLFSHNSPINDAGYNQEEMKMVNETRKIFSAPQLMITATCVRVPVLRAHSEAINLEFTQPISEQDVRGILETAPGVRLVDDREGNYFPMPMDASGGDDVLVGRIRQDISRSDGRGIDMFVSGDQLRKGAALNAVQIAELLFCPSSVSA